MGSIIVITNEKGGVGKTTTTGNLAAAYATMGKRVLAVDMDPQRNLTDLMGISQETARLHSIADAILEKKGIDAYAVPTKTEGVDLIPATPKLREIERRFGASFEQDKLLNHCFDSPKVEEYDIVIIDTHGAQNCLLTSSLAIAHYYLIPLFPEPDAARGVFDVIEYAERVRTATNRTLTLLGLMITGHDRRVSVHPRVTESLRDYGQKWNIRVFNTIIPFSSRVKTAAEQQLLLAGLREDAPVTMAYQTLAGEILPLLKGKRVGRVSQPKLEEIASSIEAFEAMDEVIE
ncbi:MAG TPA: ParA family protein [Blastocatellia bacterium]|nr:ParA family protein [Blastocatellia bacterium]